MSGGRLRICLISQEFPPYTNWGGIAVYNGALAAAYAARGHDVLVVSRTSPGAPAEEMRAGARVVRTGSAISRKRLVGRTVDRMLHARAVAAAIRSEDRRQRFDVFETTEAGLEGEQLIGDPAFRSRLIVQCNGSNQFGEAAGGLLAPLHRLDWQWSFRREQRVLRQVPRIVVTSEATRAVLAAQGHQDSRIVLIHQGIDTTRFTPDGREPRSGPLRVGFVGRLEKRKGIDFIWEVIARLAPTGLCAFHLKGAIHPASRADTEQRLSSFGSVVTHHPAGTHEEMPAFYKSIDVLLQPSRFENFGLAYVEAMASGVLVLAGRRGGGSEIITDGLTGFLIDPDGPIDPAVRVLEGMAREPGKFAPIIAAGREEVISRFSLDACATRKLDLYREMAGRA